MKKIVLLILVAFTSFAAVKQGCTEFGEDVFKSEDMKIVKSTNAFDKVLGVDLYVTKFENSKDFSSITLVMESNEELREVELSVVKVEKLKCGSRKYFAELKPDVRMDDGFNLNLGGRNFVEHRFTVELVSNLDSFCTDRDYMVKANVREGYGWANAMDSIMTVLGDAEEVN